MQTKRVILALIFILLTAACGGQTDTLTESPAAFLQTWIDAPLDGGRLGEEPYTIVISSAVTDQGGPDQIVVSVNGQVLDNLTPIIQGLNGESTYAYAQYLWNVPTEGDFLIEAWGEKDGEKGPIAQAFVTIGAKAPQDQDVPELSVRENCNGEFLPPVLTHPIGGEILNPTTPHTYQWLMTNCLPKWYDLKVFYSPHENGPTIVDNDFETEEMTWDSNSPLDPVTTYDWRLIAVGWDSDNNWYPSDWARFTTGPVCDNQNILAPNLIFPENYSTVGSPPNLPNSVEVGIAYPSKDCTPAHYEIDIVNQPSFENMSVSFGEIPSPPNYPSDRQTIPGSLVHTAFSAPLLNDCTHYFWRARAMTDPNDPVNGPFTPSFYSETRSFFTNFNGTCTTIPEESGFPYLKPKQESSCRRSDYASSINLTNLSESEPASILAINPAGTHLQVEDPQYKLKCWVWVDLVNIIIGGETVDPETALGILPIINPPDPTPTPAPIETPAPGGINGGVYNDLNKDGTVNFGEFGYEGIEINLGSGACGSSGLASTLTSSGGYFSFTNLSPGTYCVSSYMPSGCGFFAPSTATELTLEVTPGSTIEIPWFGYWSYLC